MDARWVDELVTLRTAPASSHLKAKQTCKVDSLSSLVAEAVYEPRRRYGDPFARPGVIDLVQGGFGNLDDAANLLVIMGMSRPEPDELLRLHERLVEGSPTASAEIAEILYEWLLRRLHAAVAYAPQDDVADVASEALVRYLADPTRFRPELGKSLSGFLLMDAHGDLLNLLDSRRRRPASTPLSEGVADRLEDRNIGSMTRERLLEHLPSHLDERVLALLPDQLDRGILQLMMDGVRDSDAYAALMGLRQGSREVQAREVKRAKDRIRARLKRGGISRDW